MVRIRPARLSDASTIADIQVETWRDTYAGLIPDRTLLGLSRSILAIKQGRQELYRLAAPTFHPFRSCNVRRSLSTRP